MLVEPSGPDVLDRLRPVTGLQLAAAAGAALMALTSSGDVLLLGVLLGVAAADVVVGAAAVGVGLAVLGRWGTSSLAALAGGQAVIGAAGATGPAVLAASAWCGAAALVLTAPARPVAALAFGLAAADVVAGPAVVSVHGGGTKLAIRVAASLVAVLVAWHAGSQVPRRLARLAGLVVAVVACALVLVAQ